MNYSGRFGVPSVVAVTARDHSGRDFFTFFRFWKSCCPPLTKQLVVLMMWCMNVVFMYVCLLGTVVWQFDERLFFAYIHTYTCMQSSASCNDDEIFIRNGNDQSLQCGTIVLLGNALFPFDRIDCSRVKGRVIMWVLSYSRYWWGYRDTVQFALLSLVFRHRESVFVSLAINYLYKSFDVNRSWELVQFEL